MLIHSVTPPHMLIERQELPQVTCRQVGNDILEGTQTPEGLRLSRIHSTDPALYLKSEYAPGSVYKG